MPAHELSPEAAHRRTRLILAVGLGGMILLMLGAGINAVRVLHLIREQSNLVQADAAARTGTLVSIRTKLLLSDSFVRDYLMDPDENRSADDNSQLRQVWADLEKGLDAYAAATPDTDEAEMAARLRRKIERYWESISPSLRWSNRERRERGWRSIIRRFCQAGFPSSDCDGNRWRAFASGSGRSVADGRAIRDLTFRVAVDIPPELGAA